MVLQIFWFGIALLATLTVIAGGAYVGALRALDVYHGNHDSIFLSEERRGRQ